MLLLTPWTGTKGHDKSGQEGLEHKNLQTIGVSLGDKTGTFLITAVSHSVSADHHHYLILPSKKRTCLDKSTPILSRLKRDGVVQ